MTTPELKLATAKKLPDTITHSEWVDFGGDGSYKNIQFRWKSRFGGVRGDEVKETEWLHICHLLEDRMDDIDWDNYSTQLHASVRTPFLNETVRKVISSTYQQRLKAMNKIGFL